MVAWSRFLNAEEVCASDERPASPGETVEWPEWVSDEVRARAADLGVHRPWKHQREFAELAYSGRHAALTTATGSGKSLAYLLPVLAATAEGRLGVEVSLPRVRKPEHTALYLSPTKALAHDQLRAAKELGPKGWRACVLDGDSSPDERRFAREHASCLFTNPDMLHYALLPGHRRWSRLLANLRYVVVDEAHRYQGVFGAHVAHVLRRLRRLAAHHGSAPTMLLTSATSPNAAEFGGRLVGEPTVEVVAADSAPKPRRTVVLWKPKNSLYRETSLLLGGLVEGGAQTIAFVGSRSGVELVAREAREVTAQPLASYRGGHLPQERRALERELHSGRLRGVASTNALELGMDISGMDAVVIAGYPGKLSSLWQQAGRAGRRGADALVVLVAREDPLDGFLLDHPEAIFSAPVENAVLFPGNPHVFGPHLAAAAQELPITQDDERWFGPSVAGLARTLAEQGVLRDRGGRWFWTRPDRAVDFISLRTAGSREYDIIERETGRVVGTVDENRADVAVHPGAVYLHQGETFVVDELDRADLRASVVAARPRYYTQPVTSSAIRVLADKEQRDLGTTQIHRGDVRLTRRVLGYLRRDDVTHEVWDQTELEMPSRTLATQAIWWTVPERTLAGLGWQPSRTAAAVHAMEHTAIGLLPAFAPCDRWDIGGVSTAHHEDTGRATIFIHDSLPGGAGFAHRAFEVIQDWLTAVLARLTHCPCPDGCPACVVSPKCGNANQVLNKADAAQLLAALLP